jgi:hypothetical protein
MPPGYEEMMGASRKMGGKGGKKMGPGSSSSGYPGNLEGLDDSRKKKGAKLPRP